MANKSAVVIAYDVTDNSHRTKLAQLLLGYGDRVQKSVFEARLSASEVREVLKAAAKHIDKGDSLRIYPLCKTCHNAVSVVGRPGPDLDEELQIV